MNLQSILKPIAPRPTFLKRAVPVCGAAAFVLYRLFYATGVDGRGLLVRGHYAWVSLWVLTAAVALLILLGASQLQGTDARFRRSVPAGICCVLAAAGTALTGLAHLGSGQMTYAVGAFLGAAGFAVSAVCRFMGRRPNFVMHTLVCIHYILQMLVYYQANSFDPQLQGYLFQLLACIALAVTAYQLAAADLGRGSRRWLWTAALSAVYLCILSLGSIGSGIFLTGGAWAFTCLFVPRPKKAEAA